MPFPQIFADSFKRKKHVRFHEDEREIFCDLFKIFEKQNVPRKFDWNDL